MKIFISNIIAHLKRVSWKIILYLMVSSCASTIPMDVEDENTAWQDIPVVGQYIQIKGYEIDNLLPVRINFLIRNSTPKTICLYRSLFESDHTFLYELLIKRSSGELLTQNPVGYIDEMPPDLVALKPDEVKMGSLIVGRYEPPNYNGGLLANFRVSGQYCEHDIEYMVEPEFIIESGWFSLETTEE